MDSSACHKKALELLARRPHFRAQLERKLRQRAFAESDVEEVIARLTADGYLDDRSQARLYVERSVERKAYGPRRLKIELLRRGVEIEVAEEALGEYFPDQESAIARRAAASWRPPGDKAPDALARHLDRHGFTAPVIREVLRNLRTADQEH